MIELSTDSESCITALAGFYIMVKIKRHRPQLSISYHINVTFDSPDITEDL